MDPQIASTQHWFRQIYLTGIPDMLMSNNTAFLSFLCCVAAVDALAAYRYTDSDVGARFELFITNYFPPQYAPHASNLYLFRCRMLHNFSPAHFTLVHCAPRQHLQPSGGGDIVLSDESFFADLRIATEKYFGEVDADLQLQSAMLARLQNLKAGGAIGVI